MARNLDPADAGKRGFEPGERRGFVQVQPVRVGGCIGAVDDVDGRALVGNDDRLEREFLARGERLAERQFLEDGAFQFRGAARPGGFGRGFDQLVQRAAGSHGAEVAAGAVSAVGGHIRVSPLCCGRGPCERAQALWKKGEVGRGALVTGARTHAKDTQPPHRPKNTGRIWTDP